MGEGEEERVGKEEEERNRERLQGPAHAACFPSPLTLLMQNANAPCAVGLNIFTTEIKHMGTRKN